MLYDYTEADDEWEFYIGKLFSQIISKFNKDKIKTVVEIAPGFRYKIAYALKDLNFNGTIYVIDSNEKVIEYIEEKYQQILPNAKIIGISKELKNSLNDLPKKIDLLLSNHCIDDMIIGSYIAEETETNLSYKDFITNAWKSLSKNKLKKSIIVKVYKTFEKLFSQKDIKLIVLSQYKSNLYFKLSKGSEKITKQCFNKIKKLVISNNKLIKTTLKYYPFGDDERYRGKKLLTNTQNYKNWIIGFYKKQIH